MDKEIEDMAKEEYKAKGSSKEKKKGEKINYTANFDGLCEVVLDGDTVKFLLDDGEIVDTVLLEDKQYVPPQQTFLDYSLPQLSGVLKEYRKHQFVTGTSDASDASQPSTLGCKACRRLYKDLKNYHSKISEMPEKYYIDLLVLFSFHNYLIEKFNFSPILFFFADRERGKTRTSKSLIYIARRGVMTETLREANLIRWGRDHRATILFDVKDFPKKLEKAQAEDLIYGRAERGVYASRVLFPEKGAFQDTVRFEVFGPTIVTSNRMIDDIGMSRTIVIEMKPSEKIFIFEPTKKNGKIFKNRLTGMRLAHMNQKFVEVQKEETGRIEDMLLGYRSLILTLFPKKMEIYDKIKKLIKGQKLENALDSFQAQLLQIVINHGMSVEEGSLTLTFDHICSIYNESKPEKWHLSPQSLSKTLKGMGFTSKRNSAGDKRGIFYDIDLIQRLKKIYGLEDIEEERVDGHEVSEVSEQSEKENTLATDDDINEIFDL
jgi:hypothetical protein